MAIDPSAHRGGIDINPSPLPSPNLQKQADKLGRVWDSPRANFAFAHRRQEWQLDVHGDLMPVITPFSKSPGHQGVGTRGEMGVAKAWAEDNDIILIPHDVIPVDYVSPYPTKHGKVTHRTIFQAPVNSNRETSWRHDNAAWKKFVGILRAKGIIPGPRPGTISSMLDMVTRQYENLTVPSTEDKSKRDRYESMSARLRKQIEVLNAELVEAEARYGKLGQTRSSAGIHNMLDAALDESGLETSVDVFDTVKPVKVRKVKSTQRKAKEPGSSDASDPQS